MKKKFFVALSIAVLLSAWGISFAEEAGDAIDGFYDGLASIIEENMDNADACVEKVCDYYARNRAIVKKIRAFTAESMAEASKTMDRLGEMTSEELAIMADESVKMGGVEFESYAGQERYQEALMRFSEKHPERSYDIVVKSLELLPDTED